MSESNQANLTPARIAEGVFLGILFILVLAGLGYWAWRNITAPAPEEQLERMVRCGNQMAIYGRYVTRECRDEMD